MCRTFYDSLEKAVGAGQRTYPHEQEHEDAEEAQDGVPEAGVVDVVEHAGPDGDEGGAAGLDAQDVLHLRRHDDDGHSRGEARGHGARHEVYDEACVHSQKTQQKLVNSQISQHTVFFISFSFHFRQA